MTDDDHNTLMRLLHQAAREGLLYAGHESRGGIFPVTYADHDWFESAEREVIFLITEPPDDDPYDD
jgi:hypothetical protein